MGKVLSKTRLQIAVTIAIARAAVTLEPRHCCRDTVSQLLAAVETIAMTTLRNVACRALGQLVTFAVNINAKDSASGSRSISKCRLVNQIF